MKLAALIFEYTQPAVVGLKCDEIGVVDEEDTPERFIYFGSKEHLSENVQSYLAIAWIDTFREMRTNLGFYAVLGDDKAGCLEKFGKEADTY